MEDSQKQPMKDTEDLPESTGRNSMPKENVKETRNNSSLRPSYNEHHKSQEGKRGKDRSIRRNQDTSWTRRTMYKSVQVSDMARSEKKWSRLLKWLPGFKVFKFPRGSTVPEERVFDESGNPREELSMTMWNIRDNNEQRPVWKENVFARMFFSKSLRRLILSSRSAFSVNNDTNNRHLKKNVMYTNTIVRPKWDDLKVLLRSWF